MTNWLHALSGLLALTDVLLALWVFTVLARPQRTLGIYARLTGEGATWASGRMGDQQRERLLRTARRSVPFLLALLFCWSFLCGSVLTVVRM